MSGREHFTKFLPTRFTHLLYNRPGPHPQALEKIVAHDAVARETEKLRGKNSFNDVVSSAMQAGKDMYLRSSINWVTPQNTEIQVTPEQIERAVLEQDYSGTESHTSERETLVQNVALARKTGRMILRELIEGENNLQLSSTERIVLRHSLDVLDHMDGFREAWMQQVTQNPVVQEAINRHGKDKVSEAKAELLDRSNLPNDQKEIAKELDYLYLTFQKGNNESLEAVPYRTAFKGHFDKIIASYKAAQNELMDLNEQTPESAALTEYFGKLILALNYSLPNPEKQDLLFREAEIAWVQAMNLPDTRLFLQHPMEAGYFGPLGVEVEPEFVVGILNEKAIEMNELANTTQQRMIPSLENLFPEGTPGHRSLGQTLDAMRQSRLRVYTEIGGGTHLEFQPQAACLPNRQESRAAGVNVNVNMETYKQREKHTIDTVKRLFGENSQEYQEYFTHLPTYQRLDVGVFTTGHEIGHVAFIEASELFDHIHPDKPRKKGTQERLGQKQFALIEENKADLISIATAPDNLENNPEQMKEFIKAIAYRSLRNLERIGSEELQPYINGSIVYITMMRDLGILTQQPSQVMPDNSVQRGYLKLNITDENMAKFFEACQNKLREVANLYETGQEADAHAFIAENYQENNFIQRLEVMLGKRPDPEKEEVHNETFMLTQEFLQNILPPERWKRAQELFTQLEQLPETERSEELESALLTFFALSGIPRASGNETEAIQFFKTIGSAYEKQGLVENIRKDAFGNLLWEIPASSPELDDKNAMTMIDAHVDMVSAMQSGLNPKEVSPELVGVTPEITIDQKAKDKRNPNWWFLQSKQQLTSLGADNGAMASVLAQLPLLLKNKPHGRLLCVFTLGEEVGLDGAKALDPEIFTRVKTVLNIDGETEKYPLAGSAAIGDSFMKFQIQREPAPSTSEYTFKTLTVTGPGGHSGVTIADPLRENTIKVAARVLENIPGVRISSINDGIPEEKGLNKIPSLTTIAVAIPNSQLGSFEDKVRTIQRGPKTTIESEDVSGIPPTALTAENSQQFLKLLTSLPHGVYSQWKESDVEVDQELLSPDSNESHTEFQKIHTVTNLARVVLREQEGSEFFEIGMMSRSLSNDNLDGMRTIIRTIADKYSNVSLSESEPEPVWVPNLQAQIYRLITDLYQQQNPEMDGLEPKATLGGLELGPWAKMIEDLKAAGKISHDVEMISFGPDITGAHSIAEMISGPSLARTIKLLEALIGALAKPQ